MKLNIKVFKRFKDKLEITQQLSDKNLVLINKNLECTASNKHIGELNKDDYFFILASQDIKHYDETNYGIICYKHCEFLTYREIFDKLNGGN